MVLVGLVWFLGCLVLVLVWFLVGFGLVGWLVDDLVACLVVVLCCFSI